MKKAIYHITITILIILIVISCLLLYSSFGSYTEAKWFEETDPTGRYIIEATKSVPNSPGALYAKTGIYIDIKDVGSNSIVQSFSTSVTAAVKENYCVEYDDKGITLLFKDGYGVIEGSFYFFYDSLSKLGTNVRGDK